MYVKIRNVALIYYLLVVDYHRSTIIRLNKPYHHTSYTFEMCVCTSLCLMFRLGERLNGLAQFVLGVVGEVQGSVSDKYGK